MKNAFVLAVILTLSSAAQAQMQIRTTPAYGGATDRSGFSIGPRYSNYATDVDMGIVTIETGRQHAFGLVGEYRSGAFVLDFNWDHDPEDGLEISDILPIDFGQYERDRGEFTVGWAAAPILDLQAGFRMDTFSLGGSVFGGDFFDGEDFDHSAILFGIAAHTPTKRPFGLYGKLRGFIGSVDFDSSLFASQIDSTGWRAEGGVEIPIGDSQWTAVPGFEYEWLEADPEVTVETNRFFVNFVYTFPR
ncbi:MAG TPA: hypothetical protein VFT12_11575 [Thermoanaerobaculia bacterium]|nr:hypothetical protein [Thermoanaerobaculia bacterium]